MTEERCYMCDRLASSREHVPPRNLFPESKDTSGENFRLNLITVPSCDLHNSAKSHDDEFLMVSLAGIIGNNSIGYRHRFGKVERAIRRTSNRLLDKVLTKKSQVFVVEIAENKFLDVIWGTPDAERLNRCFDQITRGLYFHHFNTPLLGAVRIHLGYLHHQDASARNFSSFIKRKTEIELAGKERYGENPQIFFYQVTDKDEFGLFLFRLCFYGGLNIYAAIIPQDAVVPKSLAFELMNHGIKTVFTLGEETYEINLRQET